MVRGSKNEKQTRPARSRTLLLSALTAAALAAGLGVPGVRPAQAAGYVYQQHTLNAGVLVNGSNPAPYLFYVLNNRPDIRPVDLNLVNPLAPAGALPSTAAYWEVPLNGVSDSQLAQYNVLYLRADGIAFAPNINEKLRRFVDGGGQLIVEYEGAPSKIGLFTGTGIGTGSAEIALPVVSPDYLLHPIVSQPYTLSASDLMALGAVPTLGTAPFPLSANASDSIHANVFTSLFSPALVLKPATAGQASASVVAAAQIGAGQVVASTLNIGQGIGGQYAVTFAPALLSAASAPDLKLLANILNWSETHPSENKTSHGNASSNGLASFSPAWQFPVTPNGTIPPSGAAVWGNFVFAVNADGVLRAFDAYPSENLTLATPTATDDGITDYSTGTSYDEIWQQPPPPNSGTPPPTYAGASAPTVAAWGNASSPVANYVFLEKHDGSLVAFNAVTGAVAPFTLTAPASGGTFTANAPAPTFYDGRLYAGQANGTMHVYDLNEGTAGGNVTGVSVTLDPNTPPSGTSEPVTAAPSVGLLPNGNTNVLIAVVPTTLNVYTVLLGGRNEPLVPYPSFGTQTGYSISRQGRYVLPNIFADESTQAVPPLVPYDFNGNVVGNATLNNTGQSPQDPLFDYSPTAGVTPPAVFTDWNMNFVNAAGTSTPPNPVNLNYISAASYSQLSTPTAAVMSAPAIARNGDYYYTETQTTNSGTNSYLVGVRNNPLYSFVRIKFRFLIPGAIANGGTPLVDGDNVNYTQISGFHFIGAPVVDDQDNVYAAATNGTSATVLCFRGDQQVSATPMPAGSTVDVSDTITQVDEDGGSEAKTIYRGDDTETYGQFLGSATSLQFYNFGKNGSVRQVAGNLTEPQPLTDTSNDTTATVTALSMHTNLAWFVTPFAVTGAITGLTQVGSSLLLTDGASLYRLSANPLVGTGRVVSTGPSAAPIGAGTVGSAPSVGGSVLVINGTNEFVARTRQITVIADNNRVLGVDGDGNAVWGVDATTRTDTTQTPNVTTKVGFNRPTALSQFAGNDYLIADTGNNRCVRFDSAGNVQWELTRFQDPYGLLGAGQPLTLSQPSSVVTRPAYVLPSADPLYPGGTVTSYLVADSGDNRVLEVSDIVDTSSNLHSHVLTWASHTGDRYGRSYRYGSAAYYPNPANSPSYLSIAATVANTRLAPLTAGGALGAVSGDAPGGSLVVFNYPASPQPFSAAPTSDLVYTTAGFYAASATGTYTPFTIRSPRFLQLYTPPASSSAAVASTAVAPFDFLYADDNGAFDLSYDATRKAFIAGQDRLQFTTPFYQSMTQPAVGVTGAIVRTGLPFIPTCVQGLSSDSQGSGTTRRYLITQNYSQGELGTATTSGNGKIGGEVFEVDVTYPPVVSGNPAMTVTGGFGVNATLSHPNLTGPLTQPTYAIRLP